MLATLAAALTLTAGGCGGSDEKNATSSVSSGTNTEAAHDSSKHLTAVDRCRAKSLDELDDLTQAQREALTQNVGGDLDAYATHACSLAESLGALEPTGDVRRTDEFRNAACVDSVTTKLRVDTGV